VLGNMDIDDETWKVIIDGCDQNGDGQVLLRIVLSIFEA
jgi:hypothetical protein